MARILVVDDEASSRKVLGVILEEDGHTVQEAGGVNEAYDVFQSRPFDLVITDHRMSDGDGLTLLTKCREFDSEIPVVMLTAFASVEIAVKAMRQGAFDFMTKPFTPDVVRSVIHRAVERKELIRENLLLKREIGRQERSGRIVGNSAAITELKRLIAKVAYTNATILITGETGTGKELVARQIHDESSRNHRPFVAVNCSAFPEQLLESQLFGHEKGAFTGADKTRPGLFEAAHTGTLFLDEAGEMSLPLQARLLRVLTDGQITRVGSTAVRTVDVRIVVATNRDLLAKTKDGTFREDLYYRLAVVPIQVPPLRDRSEDIAPLAEHFLRHVIADAKLPQLRLADDAIAALTAYDFPGNVRELRNLVERASILASGREIDKSLFPVSLQESGLTGKPNVRHPLSAKEWIDTQDGVNLNDTMQEVEKSILCKALDEAGGVQAVAARNLGISRSDIQYKLKKYGIIS